MSSSQTVLADLQRLLHNIVRVGTIAEIDHGSAAQPARVRVAVGDLLTDWSPYLEARAGATRTWNPPTVGEQVLLLAPSGNLGAALVLAGINSSHLPAPSSDPTHTVTLYPDGARIEYDHAAHALKATLPAGGTARLEAPTSVTIVTEQATIDAPQTTLTGNCLVQGTLTYQGGMLGSGQASGSSGAAVIQGPIHATQDITTNADMVAGGISLRGHTHGGVERGGSSTGAPQ